MSPPPTPPRRECVVEGAFAGGAFFDGDDGAALVDVDQRHVEPRALLQQLQIALAVGVDIGQVDQEEAVGDLDREARERGAARLFVGFIRRRFSWYVEEQIENKLLIDFTIDNHETKRQDGVWPGGFAMVAFRGNLKNSSSARAVKENDKCGFKNH